MRGMLYRGIPFEIDVYQSRRDTTIIASFSLEEGVRSLILANNIREAIRMAREEIDEILDNK